MTEVETQPVNDEAPKKSKSIVPAKYAGKYKGAADELSKFIAEQLIVDNKSDITRLFALCRANGIADEHIAPYEKAIAEKARGAEGRTRMTLRNRLATLVRKNGKLTDLEGAEVALTVAPLPVRAAKADEKVAA
jgi:hypothetical protein